MKVEAIVKLYLEVHTGTYRLWMGGAHRFCCQQYMQQLYWGGLGLWGHIFWNFGKVGRSGLFNQGLHLGLQGTAQPVINFYGAWVQNPLHLSIVKPMFAPF